MDAIGLGTADRLVGPQQATLISLVRSVFDVPEAVGGPYPQDPRLCAANKPDED